ncbi:MAG: SLBB domain-containing protein, partial [Candidatus Kapaibacterium sp.]
ETTLSEVVREAGGLTQAAYPAAGVLLRHGYDERLTAGTPEEVAQIKRLENLGVSDTANFQRQIAMRPPTVDVDMEKLLLQGDHSADVTLNDGDEIDIPTQPTTVYVYGFVNNAGFVQYQKNAPLRYYIAQAGGFANGAEESETAVIKLRSKAWMNASDTKIEPGDEIFVPKVPDFPENYALQNTIAVSGLLMGFASFVISIYFSFFKKP